MRRASPCTIHTPGSAGRAAVPATIEIAPNVFLHTITEPPAEWNGGVGFLRMQPAGNGTFRPVAQLHTCFVEIGAAAKHFGFPESALASLVIAGFVKCRQITPRKRQAEAASLLAHLRACEQDPDFWSEARRAQFEGCNP